MGYASTEELSREQAESVVEKAVEHASVLEAEEQVFLNEGGMTYAKPERENYALPTTEELIDKALNTQKALYGAPENTVDGCQSAAYAQSMQIAICNSKGLDLQYENNAAIVLAMAVVSGEQEMVNNYEVKVGKLDTIDHKALAEKAAKRASEKLGGQVAPTGVYPVVFSPEAMSSLLSTYASVFSSEVAQKGLSRLADKEGQIIASEAVTLIDDPFHKDNPMPIPFDAEGTPTVCKKVIEKGTLNTLLYNLKTAAVAGKQTTGNGAKASYDGAVNVRPFTMYLAAGEFTEEQLLEKAGKGVYINSLGGLHAGANSITGDFSLQSAGFMIENGKKTIPVKSFTVAGNFFDLLQKITAVGSNVELPSAMGMNAYGAPSVLVDDLSVAGK
jgi:PmbA protein